MPNKIFKLNGGFTLLEVMVAIFIISIGVLGVVKMIPSLSASAQVNSSRLVAAYLAQEGIEMVRNIRDTNWLEAHIKGDSTPWDEDFFSPVDCANGCEMDYTALANEDPSFAVYSSADKLKIDSEGLYKYNCSGCPETKFSRKITIQESSDILTITANVSWEDRGRTYNFPVQEKLYKWY